MAYIDNPFSAGETVVCIKDNFILQIADGRKERIGTLATEHPKVGEMLEISEILGEFLRFDKYDCWDISHPDYGWRWWKHTHFAKPDESETAERKNQNLIINVFTSQNGDVSVNRGNENK